MLTSLITLLLVIAIVGFVVWLLTRIDMPPVFHQILVAVAAIGVILYALRVFGYGSSLHL